MMYTREQLIGICEQAVVSVKDWNNRDSATAHENIGHAWALLKAGCEFYIHTKENQRPSAYCISDESTIWITIDHPGFECSSVKDSFFLPTPERLNERKGEDWY